MKKNSSEILQLVMMEEMIELARSLFCNVNEVTNLGNGPL